VPEEGRLDTALGTLWSEPPTTFRVAVRADGEQAETLLEKSHGDRRIWAQHSIDLSAYAGQVVTLSLEAESERDGSVALWGAPTLTGPRATDRPNVIFYIIDGAGAEYMSVYGYNRRTTPNMERLAAEGAVFERAYSNSSWTRPSTASFMTSLQHSVLGGIKNGFNVVPDNALTMAQHMHEGGYQTAVFTANTNAGRMSGLEREVDFFREDWAEFSYSECDESSKYLHEAFWKWREDYPAEPYWVHFQTIDIHNSSRPPATPFAGLFVSYDEHMTRVGWIRRLHEAGSSGLYSEAWEKLGISRSAYSWVKQGFYDEGMAHNDYQLGRLVERLKATGEWENTLLIVGADHGILIAAGNVDIARQDPLPPRWNSRSRRPRHSPMLRPAISRIPLLFVWPGHIQGGQRFSGPVVSMIDVLPTILDLVGLPLPEVKQGQSLAPMLLGEGEWKPRPVILDEFYVDQETGELRGLIEVVDGRWGASLEINPDPEELLERQRPVPLLLYDLWNSPVGLYSVHEEHPDLVEKYTAFLEAQFEAHQALAQYFTPAEDVVLKPEQLQMLRALGYIQ
jgi:arylsulfatase A-like enzyme